MRIGEFQFRTKRKGFLQPEPAEVGASNLVSFVPEPARPLPEAAAQAGRVMTTYLEGVDRVQWVHGAVDKSGSGAYNSAGNRNGRQLTGVEYSDQQPVTIANQSRNYYHWDVQARRQGANTYRGGASFFTKGKGFGPTAGTGSATPRHPGGGPTIMRPPPRNLAVIRVPRFSTLPAQIDARSTTLSGAGSPGAILPTRLTSTLSQINPRYFIAPVGVK